jgi:1-acyl-sn-glycerol-3-phosphate acyltransferase
MLAAFHRYARRYVAKSFHSLRLSKAGEPRLPADVPWILYLNHPSWWDPLLGLLLARELFPGRHHYAPMDAAALARYRFFARLGFFGVEQGTLRGSRAFLERGGALFRDPLAVLWITPAGRFGDPRERPAVLRPGLAHLARRLPRGALAPVAIEYPFWEERFPEILVRFGEPIAAGNGQESARDWEPRLRRGLEETQDALAGEAVRRDPAAFRPLLQGAAGVGGPYDAWRRLKAAVSGRSFEPGHGSERP